MVPLHQVLRDISAARKNAHDSGYAKGRRRGRIEGLYVGLALAVAVMAGTIFALT